MTPEQSKKFNTAFGGIFLATGVIAWILAFYFAMTPAEPAPVPVSGVASVDLPSCRTALSQLGYTVSIQDHDVVAFEGLTGNPQEQLQKASIAALLCKLPMKNFCMGEGCEQPGLTMTVRKPTERAMVEKVDRAEKTPPSPKDGKDGKDAKAAAKK